MQTILGAGGAIGKELATALYAYDKHIRLVARNPVQVNPTDELFQADLRDAAAVDQAVRGSTVVYLCVGLPYRYQVWKSQWPTIIQNTIDACVQHQAKLVFIDNVYMYSANALSHMKEDAEINPPSKKGKIRQQLIRQLFEAKEKRGLQVCIARSADFYGPGINNSILLELVYANLKKGKNAFWQCAKNKIHSFTYTPDAAKAVALLGNSSQAYGHVWHLPTSAERLTGEEWVKRFAKQMNQKPKITVIPRWILKIAGYFVPLFRELEEMSYQYQQDYFFDSSKFMQAFPFQVTPVDQAIHEIVTYQAV